MIERILSRRDAERDMIKPRERPRISNPAWQKRHYSRRVSTIRQWRAIAERNFHLGRRQRTCQLFRDRTVGAVGPD